MGGIDDIRAGIERERYKLLSEVERFEKLKENYEQLVERAKTDPKVAAQLKEFEVLHGAMLLQDMASIAEQINRAKGQYQSLKHMVGMGGAAFSDNAKRQKVDGNALSERKEKVKSILHKNFM